MTRKPEDVYEESACEGPFGLGRTEGEGPCDVGRTEGEGSAIGRAKVWSEVSASGRVKVCVNETDCKGLGGEGMRATRRELTRIRVNPKRVTMTLADRAVLRWGVARDSSLIVSQTSRFLSSVLTEKLNEHSTHTQKEKNAH